MHGVIFHHDHPFMFVHEVIVIGEAYWQLVLPALFTLITMLYRPHRTMSMSANAHLVEIINVIFSLHLHLIIIIPSLQYSMNSIYFL